MDFCSAIDATALSQAIQSMKWVVPTVQTVHIIGIAAVMASILMINLRLLRIRGTEQSIASVSNRFRPVVWWTLPVLLVSGAILIIGEPARSLANWSFQLKMFLLICVIAVTVLSQHPLAKDPQYWDVRPAASRIIALLSLTLWIGIVFAARWIAYI
jgi:hypothetical protein